jgi:hypothetical protein
MNHGINRFNCRCWCVLAALFGLTGVSSAAPLCGGKFASPLAFCSSKSLGSMPYVVRQTANHIEFKCLDKNNNVVGFSYCDSKNIENDFKHKQTLQELINQTKKDHSGLRFNPK